MNGRPTDAAERDDELADTAQAERQRLAEAAADTSLNRRSFAELAANQRASTSEYLEDGDADDD